MLEKLGYQVLIAENGEKALELFEMYQDTIDLVILDMIMPGISGSEAFDRMREINSAVRVLLSSGYSIDGKAMEILKRGCNGFIQKPYSIEQISEKIHELMKRD